MSRFVLIFSFLLFIGAIVSAQPTLTGWRTFPSAVYEYKPVYLTVNVTSKNQTSKVYAGVTNYSTDLLKRSTRMVDLQLFLGNTTNGLWIYTFSEKAGIYIINNITATDINNISSTVFPDDLGFKVVTNATIIEQECKANFYLGRTEFNSSEIVNYSVKMINQGIDLTNISYSIFTQLDILQKPLASNFLKNNSFLYIRFDFLAPNISEDENYPIELEVRSNECNFTYEFQFLVKKFLPEEKPSEGERPSSPKIWFPSFEINVPEITIPFVGWKVSGTLAIVLTILLVAICILIVLMILEFIKVFPVRKGGE